MFETFLSTLPLSIASAISVTSILLFLAILVSGKNQVRNGLAFIIGGIITAVVITLVELLSIHKVNPGTSPDYAMHAVVDFVLAGICFLLLIITFIGWNKPEQEKKKEDKKPGGVFTYIIMGALIKLVSANTLPPFIGAIKEVAAAQLGGTQVVVLCTMIILISMLPVIIPYLLFLLNQQKALVMIDPASVFLKKYKNLINSVVLTLVVFYLCYHGYIQLYGMK
ncbi:MAG: GAP family protein [Bacteroidota bacterium]